MMKCENADGRMRYSGHGGVITKMTATTWQQITYVTCKPGILFKLPFDHFGARLKMFTQCVGEFIIFI